MAYKILKKMSQKLDDNQNNLKQKKIFKRRKYK